MTNAELAILSLVAELPRYGYQIEQTLEERGMREWTEIGFSSIYYLLKKLEKTELIAGKLEEAGQGPARKVYHITELGKTALAEGLHTALSVPQRCYPPFQLGLANLPAFSNADVQAALETYRQSLQERLEQLQEKHRSQQPVPYFVDAMFDYSFALITAEINWIDKFLRSEMMATKVDFKKTLKHLYNPSNKEFTIVDVPAMNFLMVDGRGNPNTSPDYQAALEALYGMSYGLRFALKAQGFEYVVSPLEGLWWTDDMSDFSDRDKENWNWTMMIMQPEWVTPELVEAARSDLAKKKNLVALPELRFESYHEGLSVQIQYLGSYDEEHPTIMEMHAFAQEQGYILRGKHHEIYLSDPRRTAPEKLKTILRQPIAKS